MISVPRAPTGRLDPPPDVEHFTVVTVTFDGARCSYEDRTLFGPDEAVRFDFANTTGADASLIVYNDHLPLDSIAVLAPGHGENSGFVVMSAGGTYALTCAVPDWDNWDPTFVEGPTLTVQTG
jgi:hypothetical protein